MNTLPPARPSASFPPSSVPSSGSSSIPPLGDRLSSIPPRGSLLPPAPQTPEKLWIWAQFLSLLEHLGHMALLLVGSLRVIAKRPLELREIVAQLEAIGLKSMGLVCITGLFVGMVMALQFALGLQKFGGMEYTGRVIALSFSRELAPTLTAVIAGGRIGAGIAAEIGSMAVTEQVDAIRALGADPIKKLVMPRLIASTLIMPALAMFSLVLGFSGAMLIAALQFGQSATFFLNSSLDSLVLQDFWSGYLKTPVFGALIALIGCHFGLITSGGTQGVGRATTRAVVVVSISILIADFMLTTMLAWVLRRG